MKKTLVLALALMVAVSVSMAYGQTVNQTTKAVKSISGQVASTDLQNAQLVVKTLKDAAGNAYESTKVNITSGVNGVNPSVCSLRLD